MRKYRILILTGIAYRDIGTCYVLKRLLEARGHTCVVMDQSRGTRFYVCAWKPDAVFCMRGSSLEYMINRFPGAKIFYCPGEGGERFQTAEEKIIASNQTVFNGLTRAFLWGPRSIKHIKQQIEEDGEESPAFGKESRIDNFVQVVGHPRIDLIRYLNTQQRKDGKIRLGFVGSFAVLNHVTRRNLLGRVLSNENAFKTAIFQTKLANTYRLIIENIDIEKYEISIRPYVAENRDEYDHMKVVETHGVSIDQSFEFGTWASQQDLIVCPTSSVIPQLVMAGKPYVLVDFVDNEPEQTIYRISLSRLFHQNLSYELPTTLDQLLYIIKHFDEIELTTPRLNEILENVYNLSPAKVERERPEPALLQVVDAMELCLCEKGTVYLRVHLPKFVTVTMDALLNREDRESYNDVYYPKIAPYLKQEFDIVVKQILSEEKNRAAAAHEGRRRV